MRIRLVVAVLALGTALAATGLWLAARLWPERLCDPRIGLRVHAQGDARSTGYLLRARDERPLRGAVYDLVQGRVPFFERETQQGFVRYQLGDIRSRYCLRRERVDEQLAGLPMPAGHCVQAVSVTAPKSRYRVEIEGASGGGLEWSRIVDQEDGSTLAEYRRASVVPSALLGLACPRISPGFHGKLSTISGFVFKDRWGGLLRGADLGAAPDAAELPPVADVRGRLAQEGRLDRRECHLPGWMGETEVHEVELPGGPLKVGARLDAQSTTAGVVLLDVHTPDKAAVIIAKAKHPTIWHVHESGASNIVAFIVRGDSGQAVLGLTPYSRILMSTREHNPQTNCSATELKRIEHEVTARHGRPYQHRQETHDGKPAVRYSIGEPMKDGSLQFHYASELSDYEVSEK